MAGCKIPQAPNGEPSKLYLGLSKLLSSSHYIANYIYATYVATDVDSKMDAVLNPDGTQKYERDANGEHKAQDVYDFLNMDVFIDEANKNIPAVTKGTIFHSAIDALNVADSFNNRRRGKVAYVTQQGNTFSVITENRDSRTQAKAAEVQKQLQMWDAISTAITNAGIDMTSFDFIKDIANPIQVTPFMQYLNSLPRTANRLLSVRDIKTLLTIGKHNTQVNSIMTRGWGNIDQIAQKCYDSFNVPGSVTPTVATLIDNALTAAKNYPFNMSDIQAELNNITNNFANSEVETIQREIEYLHNKYGINKEVIVRTTDKINKLSEAAADAIITLQIQLRHIQNLKGRTSQAQAIEANIQQIFEDIEKKQYYKGMLTFLNQALSYSQTVTSILQNIPTSGTKLEYSIARSNALERAKRFRDGYAKIVTSILGIDALDIDDTMSDADKQQLKDLARQVADNLQKQDNVVNEIAKNTMIDLCEVSLGNKIPDGNDVIATSSVVAGAVADSTMFDFLYSVGRVSNPMVNAMGTLIRDTQDERQAKMNQMSLRIRRITNKYYKSGEKKNTEFMYAEDGHIISDIDWVSYNRARSRAIARFKAMGFKGFELRLHIQQWEDANTEDRVVNPKDGRTERVPNSAYQDDTIAVWDDVNNRLVFQNGIMTQAQQEYYDAMMELKGEIGSLLPAYAQKQYLPAQIRKSLLDVALDVKKVGFKKSVQIILDKMKFWKMREDDDLYAQNGNIVNGDEVSIVNSDFDGSPLRQVPIFYINELRGEENKKTGQEKFSGTDVLLRDFSSGIQALASTALNYEAMSKMKDVAEFMRDYINDKGVSYSKNGKSMYDKVEGQVTSVFKALFKINSTLNSKVLDGFIDYHIYGEKTKNTGLWARLLRGLINYSSLRGLAVNLKGAASNYLVGELQNVIEAAGQENFGYKDLTWAHAIMFGNSRLVGAATLGVAPGAGRIMDFFENNVNSKPVLLAQLFDPVMDEYSEKSHQRYHGSFFRKIFGSFNPTEGYSYGEYLIHTVNMLAMLNHQKMYLNGKEISLYDALEVVNRQDGNSEIKLKDGVTIGKCTKIGITSNTWEDTGELADDAFLQKFKGKIRATNQKCHGSMNEEDKGIIHQYMVGKAIMNFRQWMIEHYSRRWRTSHHDSASKEFDEGYRLTGVKNLMQIAKFGTQYMRYRLGFDSQCHAHWDTLSDKAKSNIRRYWAENALIGILFTASMAFGDPDKKNRDWWTRFWMYQTKRALMDENASTALGSLLEAKTMINSPVSSVNTFNGFLYPIVGLPEIGETIKSGRYKGWNKYARGIYKYTLPFTWQIDQAINLDQDDGIFQVFDSSNYYK